MQDQNNGRGILLEAGTNEVEFLECTIGGERFGINVAKVVQILTWRALRLTQVPGCNEKFLGTVPFRDRQIEAFDSRGLLGVEPAVEQPLDNRLLIAVQFNQRTYGLRVDDVHKIERVSWNKYTALAQDAVGDNSSAVVGTIVLEGRVILILDLESMMGELHPGQSLQRYSEHVQVDASEARKNMRLLYCEDSRLIQKIATESLAKAGFTNIEVYSTAAEGLKSLKDRKGAGTDIIISDIEMPEMDGLTFCRAVKSDPELQKIPFLFFSSLINDQMKVKCEAVGGNACFSKPELHLVAEAVETFRKALASTPT